MPVFVQFRLKWIFNRCIQIPISYPNLFFSRLSDNCKTQDIGHRQAIPFMCDNIRDIQLLGKNTASAVHHRDQELAKHFCAHEWQMHGPNYGLGNRAFPFPFFIFVNKCGVNYDLRSATVCTPRLRLRPLSIWNLIPPGLSSVSPSPHPPHVHLRTFLYLDPGTRGGGGVECPGVSGRGAATVFQQGGRGGHCV